VKINSTADRIICTDLLIIGSEAAGARAAIEAHDRHGELTIAVVTKGYLGRSGATVTAGSDYSVDGRSVSEILSLKGERKDSPEIFFEDIIKAGRYLNNQHLTEIHVEEAPWGLKDLVDWGIRIKGIQIHPGHSYPRGVAINGREYPRVLDRQLKKRRIKVIEHMMMTDLLTRDGRVLGAVGLHLTTGGFWIFKAKATIVCTGGGMSVYPYTTAPEGLTGDGLAFAYRAGVELINMEFPQFLPYCLLTPPAVRGSNFPYVLTINLETHALNRKGERYMKKWDPVRLEFTTRDIGAIAAMVEVLGGRGSELGGTYLSLKHLPDNLIDFSTRWFTYPINWKRGSLYMKDLLPDLGRDAIETAPACHFFCGGIKINERCETNMEGLYAAGEAAGNLHGADRLSGNAMTETQVWGKRAGKFASDYAAGVTLEEPDIAQVQQFRARIFGPLGRQNWVRPVGLKKEIQRIAWDYVGVVRSKAGLEKAIEVIEDMKGHELDTLGPAFEGRVLNRDWQEILQVQNMLLILEMIARASLLREESRGCHYRSDHPYTDNKNWLKNIVIQRLCEGMVLTVSPAVITKMEPNAEVINYGLAHL
jgi:succinate dehydrogenase/fumarate reductase flavoprotein subunit